LIATAAGVVAVAVATFLLFGSTRGGIGGPIAQAATTSSTTPGYRIRMSIEVASSALSTPVTATASGVVDLRDHASAIAMAMNLGADPEVIQRLGVSTIRMEMITDGGTVYLKLPPALTSLLTSSSRQWMKLDIGKVSKLPGLSSLGSNPATNDPADVLQSLRSVSGKILDLGPERVGGVETAHYRADLSVAQLAASLPSAQDQAAQKTISALAQAVPGGVIPVDVWVDPRHLVRRVLMTLDLQLPNGRSMQERVTAAFSDYGPQARPAAPPADEVLDLNSLTGASG
jgi:hypothetical protein